MKIKIEFEEEHLPIISRALEAYARAKMGQFGIMLDNIFPEKLIGWEDRNEIERLIRDVIFDEPKMNSLGFSYGVGNEKTGDGQAAYEIHKVVNQYLAVQRSGGKWGYTTDYDDPLEYSGVALPEIEGFKKYVDYPIDDSDHKFTKLFQAKDWKACWEYIGEKMEYIFRGERAEIVESPYVLVGEKHVDYFLRIHKPKLDKKEF